MSKFAVAFTQEIDRRARRESRRTAKDLKGQIVALKKLVRAQRERLVMLEKAVRKAAAESRASAPTPAAGAGKERMSARSIRSHRKRLGLSQVQLAALTGVTPVAVYMWESGKTTPQDSNRAKLLELRRIGAREAKSRLAGTSRSKAKRKTGSATRTRKKATRKAPKKKTARRKATGQSTRARSAASTRRKTRRPASVRAKATRRSARAKGRKRTGSRR